MITILYSPRNSVIATFLEDKVRRRHEKSNYYLGVSHRII